MLYRRPQANRGRRILSSNNRECRTFLQLVTLVAKCSPDLQRLPQVRQFRQVPQGVRKEQSPDAGHHQIAAAGLQQVGGDAGDEHKQKWRCHQLKSKSGIVR